MVGSAREAPYIECLQRQAPWYRAAVVPLAKRILCLAEDREAMMSCAPASEFASFTVAPDRYAG